MGLPFITTIEKNNSLSQFDPQLNNWYCGVLYAFTFVCFWVLLSEYILGIKFVTPQLPKTI